MRSFLVISERALWALSLRLWRTKTTVGLSFMFVLQLFISCQLNIKPERGERERDREREWERERERERLMGSYFSFFSILYLRPFFFLFLFSLILYLLMIENFVFCFFPSFFQALTIFTIFQNFPLLVRDIFFFFLLTCFSCVHKITSIKISQSKKKKKKKKPTKTNKTDKSRWITAECTNAHAYESFNKK